VLLSHGEIDMRRDEIISRIRKHSDAIRAEGATALYLFGSVARDQAHADSDIDVFVDYDPKSKFSLLNMSGIRLIIMDETGRDVDITTSDSLHPRLRDRILAEAVRVL
jgi:predicted nucleotidyltransferase